MPKTTFTIDDMPASWGLTASQLFEMRRCNRISIGSHIDDEGRIVAAHIVLQRDVKDTMERTVFEPVQAYAHYSGSLRGSSCDRHKGGCVNVVLSHYTSHDTIPTALGTIIECLKVGDKLVIEWAEAGYGNQIMDEKGMIMDHLTLRVHRPRKGNAPDKILVFPLDYVITVPTSSARWFHTK